MHTHLLSDSEEGNPTSVSPHIALTPEWLSVNSDMDTAAQCYKSLISDVDSSETK